MATLKASLKAAKSAIDDRRYQDALLQAEQALAGEPNSYHANVFRALALDKLNQPDDSVRAYRAAINAKETEPLAWQGLLSLLERQGQQKVDEYLQAALRLAEIYKEAADADKCQNVVEKLQLHVKNHGSRSQQRKALEILLPSSSVYDTLEGRIRHPSDTYTNLAEILEAEERDRISGEIAKRRTRLGARIDQVRRDVRREVLSNSTLEDVYREIINWTRDDAERRAYEEKLLRHAHETLTALPIDQKHDKRAQVQEMARGMVIIKHPFEVAWTIELEWKDVESLASMDIGVLEEFISFFPKAGLGKVLKGYLSSDLSPIARTTREDATAHRPTSTEDEPDAESGVFVTSEDSLVLMMDGVVESPESVFAQRLMAEYYLYLEEFEAAVETARKGLVLVANMAQDTGLNSENTTESLQVTLATSLIRYQPPRHFQEAQTLFDKLLKRNPHLTPALVGKGHLLGEQEDYPAALELLKEALARKPEDLIVKLEVAWHQALCGDCEAALGGLEACLPRIQGTDTRTRGLKAKTLYRIGVCLWNVDESPAARRSRTGAYSRFLGALQADANYAPAYTSLGLYYADYARDKRRARKCFLKAIELSASEIVAAERLARMYADEGDWDLVELAAQRAIESGKTRPSPGSKNKGVSWPHAALGIVELNRQDFAKSIVSYQQALRIAPQDYHSWIGLGESYHNSGRFIAATKAFEQAERIQADLPHGEAEDGWFAKFLSANVKRELGQFEDAIQEYSAVLDIRPNEFGVSIALVQTLVEGAWQGIEQGFFGQASDYAERVIIQCTSLADKHFDVFNLWKTAADACAIFPFVYSHLGRFSWSQVKTLLGTRADSVDYDVLGKLDGVGKQTIDDEKTEADGPTPLERCLHSAILAHKRSIHVSAKDAHARAVAWYNLGWAEYRAHVCLLPEAHDSAAKRTSGYLKASIQCFKRAIETEARNSEFWNALGVVTSTVNAKISQHSLVRSLFLNDKNAQVWTNLGTLYLLHGDKQLANKAFSRAQATDPEYPQAWLGQGLLAKVMGEEEESRLLVTHAFEIADGSFPLARSQYAFTMFDQLLAGRANADITSLIQPLFALHQLRSQSRLDTAIEHISALFSERARDYSAASNDLAALCDSAEQEYEVSESLSSLTRFAQGKADLARTLLAARQYEDAAESAETALQLSATDDGTDEPSIADPVARQKCRLGAHVTAGLAHYYTGSMDDALNMFNNALDESEGSADVVDLLAQVLWAKGGQPERSVATQQLLDVVASEPNHISSILLLGVIAMLESDQTTLDTVLSKLERHRVTADLNNDQRRRTQALLLAIAACNDGQGSSHAIRESKMSIMQCPAQPHGWTQLATFCDEAYLAEMALKAAQHAVPPRGALGPEMLAETYAGTNRAADMQSAIMVAPWVTSGWNGLAEIFSAL